MGGGPEHSQESGRIHLTDTVNNSYETESTVLYNTEVLLGTREQGSAKEYS